MGGVEEGGGREMGEVGRGEGGGREMGVGRGGGRERDGRGRGGEEGEGRHSPQVPSAQLSTIPGSRAPWRVQGQKRKLLVHTQPGRAWLVN